MMELSMEEHAGLEGQLGFDDNSGPMAPLDGWTLEDFADLFPVA